MVVIELNSTEIKLYVQGADKLWALKSELTIPLEHIVSVRTDAEVVKQWFHGLKMPGTSVPGVITAGTFFQDGKRVFWDIHHPERVLVLVLRDETYNELVVEHPEIVAGQISKALQ
jgi:hypothetical protein